jgi:hypothetical protein
VLTRSSRVEHNCDYPAVASRMIRRRKHDLTLIFLRLHCTQPLLVLVCGRLGPPLSLSTIGKSAMALIVGGDKYETRAQWGVDDLKSDP